MTNMVGGGGVILFVSLWCTAYKNWSVTHTSIEFHENEFWYMSTKKIFSYMKKRHTFNDILLIYHNIVFFTFNIQLTCFSSCILFQWNNLNVKSMLWVSLTITKVKKDPKFNFLFSTIFKAARKTEAVAERCSVKKVFSEISQNSQENTCAGVSFLIKLQACSFIFIKRLWRRCFPGPFAKFLRTPYLQDTSGRLLLRYNSNASNFLISLSWNCSFSWKTELWWNSL